MNKDLEHIWEKARKIPDQDSNHYRVDDYGNIIKKESYGKQLPMGWTVYEVQPVVMDVFDSIENYRPVHISRLY